MCVVSMVHDYGRKNFPPVYEWDVDDLTEYEEIIRRLDRLDRRFNQPDCVDPAKQKFMDEIRDRLSKLEQKAGIGETFVVKRVLLQEAAPTYISNGNEPVVGSTVTIGNDDNRFPTTVGLMTNVEGARS